jgi:hypothetical protein
MQVFHEVRRAGKLVSRHKSKAKAVEKAHEHRNLTGSKLADYAIQLDAMPTEKGTPYVWEANRRGAFEPTYFAE